MDRRRLGTHRSGECARSVGTSLLRVGTVPRFDGIPHSHETAHHPGPRFRRRTPVGRGETHESRDRRKARPGIRAPLAGAVAPASPRTAAVGYGFGGVPAPAGGGVVPVAGG